MKKYWQIRPWMLIVIVLVLAVSIFYAIGDSNKFSYSQDSSGSTRSMEMIGYAPSAMPAVDMAFDMDEEAYYEKNYNGDDGSDYAEERMIIKTGSLSIVVDDVSKSVNDIISFAEEKGGFLVTSNVDKEGIDVNGYLTVRVPSELLDDTLTYIKEMGDVKSERVDGQDITEEYVDLEAKLKNLEAAEIQFLEIMKKAVRIEDILAVQRELTWVREDIERIEGRMKYLKESVDMSSITVYLSTNPSTLPVVDEEDKWKPLAVLKEALRSLLGTGQEVVNAIIWFAVYLPVLIVVLLILWGIKRLIFRKKK